MCKTSTSKYRKYCHQWLSDSFRVHQIRFRPWLCPEPRWGSLQRSTRHLAAPIVQQNFDAFSFRKSRPIQCIDPQSTLISYPQKYSQHLQSTTRRLLVVPRCRLCILSPRAFSVAGPSLWNSLPDSLRDPDLGRDSFRRLLKTHLFTLY